MVEQQKKRVEDTMMRMVEEIEKLHLRKMQADMHKCAAICCENENYSMQKVQNCIENCSSSFTRAQQYVQNEFERVQNRLQRCLMECNDSIKDKMGPKPTHADINKYTDEFDQCATKCVDSYCDLLPNMEKTMNDVLSSKKF